MNPLQEAHSSSQSRQDAAEQGSLIVLRSKRPRREMDEDEHKDDEDDFIGEDEVPQQPDDSGTISEFFEKKLTRFCDAIIKEHKEKTRSLLKTRMKLQTKVDKMRKHLVLHNGQVTDVINVPKSLVSKPSIETPDGVLTEDDKTELYKEYIEAGKRVFVKIYEKTEVALLNTANEFTKIRSDVKTKLKESIKDEMKIIPEEVHIGLVALNKVIKKVQEEWEQTYLMLKWEYNAHLAKAQKNTEREANAQREEDANMEANLNMEQARATINKCIKDKTDAMDKKIQAIEKKLATSTASKPNAKANANAKTSQSTTTATSQNHGRTTFINPRTPNHNQGNNQGKGKGKGKRKGKGKKSNGKGNKSNGNNNSTNGPKNGK